ncbi:ECF transporter S component [uncultured Limosilactobacillus sp.]|uniref:ECF transporter S component n=1 Tax=uncultured Limosilactobacillus sp. TaxID=2837629 RepID=UPI0025FF1684|nr:ECF transporter S component [uncultured Limosilactobacillus sp.]
MYKTYSHTKRFTMTACLAAVAFLLMFIEFPIIPVVSYLKLDFSDVPVLLGTFIYGPWTGILIALLKCLLHGLTRGLSPVEMLGLFANLCTSVALIIPFNYFFHRGTWSLGKRLLIGTVMSTAVMTIVMTAFNYYLLTPAYMKMFNWHPSLPIDKMMIIGVLPFNLIKGIVVGLVFSIILRHMQIWLKSQI